MQGGVGAFTRELARTLAQTGHDVHIFTRIEARPAPGADASDDVNVSACVSGCWGWPVTGTIRQWARENRLDVVNVQFQTAAYNMHPAIHWLPARLREMPVVVTFHDLRAPYLFPKAGPARRWVVRKLAQDADGVIATDRADEAILRNEWHIVRLAWVPIGSNVSTTPPPGYDRASWRAALGIGPNDLLIAYFGFLNESKGGLVLIEALARLAAESVPAHLVMIGGRVGASDPTDVAYGRRVDALIEACGLLDRVHWTGFVDDPQVSAHFYASDVTALPYLDGVSLRRGTLMAALAHGRAIVTTTPERDAPELAGVVETVPPGDARALAGAIRRLWHSPGERQRLERAALASSRNFGWRQIAARTAEFFASVAAASPLRVSEPVA